MRLSSLIILFVLSCAVQAESSPLNLEWSHPISKGVDRIDLLDIRNDGTPEVYAVSYHPLRTSIQVYRFNGKELFDTVVPREAVAEYGDEDTKIAAVSDVDADGFLDIFSGTQIRVASVNNHRLYRHHRIPEEGLEHLYVRYDWMVKDTGLVTSISFQETGKAGVRYVITSSVDGRVRAIDHEGNVILELNASGSVWDAVPVDADGDGDYEYLAAAFRGLYLYERNNTLVWAQPAKDRYLLAAAHDITGDGFPELIGLEEETVKVFDLGGSQLYNVTAPNIRAVSAVGVYGTEGMHLLVAYEKTLMFVTPDGRTAWMHEEDARIRSLASHIHEEQPYVLVGTDEGVRSYTLDEEPFKADKAIQHLTRAYSSLGSQDYNASIHDAKASAELYRQMRMIVNETEALDLVEKATALMQAKKLYDEAQMHYGAGRYNDSVVSAQESFEIYGEQGYGKGVALASDLLSLASKKAQTMMERVREQAVADDYYDEAEALYLKGEYDKSLRLAQLALNEYETIGDEQAMRLAETLINLNMKWVTTTTVAAPTTTTLAERAKTTDDYVMYGALTLAALILVALLYTRIRGR